ncbi:hypothetical protein BDZ91DRAFT_247046 [Kalaharituber pfeilii]|nr:hypothetical protein BDZ91DRAFT_247046 [Kalaharituber pfeilii]
MGINRMEPSSRHAARESSLGARWRSSSLLSSAAPIQCWWWSVSILYGKVEFSDRLACTASPQPTGPSLISLSVSLSPFLLFSSSTPQKLQRTPSACRASIPTTSSYYCPTSTVHLTFSLSHIRACTRLLTVEIKPHPAPASSLSYPTKQHDF